MSIRCNETKNMTTEEFTQNQLFACGLNYWFQSVLGKDKDDSFIATPTTPVFDRNIDDEKIIQVALGAEFSLVLTESGKCFVGGLYAYGQFGTKTKSACEFHDSTTKVFEYIHTLSHVKVVQISCGAEHSCFLTDEGRVFLCGYNLHNEISNDTENVHFPLEIQPLDIFGTNENIQRIRQVVAGNWHTAFLTYNGYVYARGKFVIHKKNNEIEYTKINDHLVVDKMRCGENFTVMRDINHDIYILYNEITGLVKIASREIVDFDCRDLRLALLNDKSECSLYSVSDELELLTTEYADDCDNFQTQCHAIQIVLSAIYVALVYSDGHIRFLTNIDELKFVTKQWITNVSLPKCRNMNTKLVASAGYQHFMFYWDQYNSNGVTLFLQRLNRCKSDALFSDIDIL
jgi:hypothetical protein